MKTNYYYDPPESLNMVEGPGEYCDICQELNVVKAGTLIPVNFEDGDLEIEFAHHSCLLELASTYKDGADQLFDILADQRG